jgi:hypothetical protein
MGFWIPCLLGFSQPHSFTAVELQWHLSVFDVFSVVTMGIVNKLVNMGVVASSLALTTGPAALDTTSTYTCHNRTAPHVTLNQGGVQGFRDSHANSVFLGVPYAATTGGQNR